jgi:hypothetical protein
VFGEICAPCCGNERERTIHCPLDCVYLQEARRREEPEIADPATFPNADIRVTEQFLRAQEPLLIWIAMHLLRAALDTKDAIDNDAKEALATLVQTYRTLQSGLVYETQPVNPIAAALYAAVQNAVQTYRQQAQEASGMQSVRDTDVLGVLAFLQRMEIQQNNGRRLGRAFIDFLRYQFPQNPQTQEPSQLIV